MKKATYRVIGFPIGSDEVRYVAVAWNYDLAVLISTRDHATYTEARAELTATCAERGVSLAWFDGEYKCVNGVLVNAVA